MRSFHYHVSNIENLRFRSITIHKLLSWRPQYLLYFDIAAIRQPVFYGDDQGRVVLFDSFESITDFISQHFRRCYTVTTQLIELSEPPLSDGDIAQQFSEAYLRQLSATC